MLKNLFGFSLAITLIVTFALDAGAQTRRRSTGTYTDSTSYSSPTTTSSGGMAGRMSASGALGFFGTNGGTITANNAATGQPTLSGFFGLGGDFDYFMSDDWSVGGIFRYYSSSDSAAFGSAGNAEYTDTLMTIGGTVKAYVFDTTHWQGNITTGLGMVTAQVKAGSNSVDSGTSFGFYWGLTLLYKMSSDMAFGVENMRMIALGSSLNGWPLSDYMLKARFMF
ncbi:MAG: hypothetical protein ABL958_12420 [Bdellovibrionia bacterium]